MKKILIGLFISQLLLLAQPTETMKGFVKESLAELKSSFKKTKGDFNLLDTYLDDNAVVYEFNYSYDEYMKKIKFKPTKEMENMTSLRKLNENFLIVDLRKNLRNNICGNEASRSLLKKGFIYKMKYKWETENDFFLVKTIDEKECLERFDNK